MTNIDPNTNEKLLALLGEMKSDALHNRYRSPQHIQTLENILHPLQTINQLLANGYTEGIIQWMYGNYDDAEYIITKVQSGLAHLLNPKSGNVVVVTNNSAYPNTNKPKHNPSQYQNTLITEEKDFQDLGKDSIIHTEGDYWVKELKDAHEDEWCNTRTHQYATNKELTTHAPALFIYQPQQPPF